jgi:hypothetical protein
MRRGVFVLGMHRSGTSAATRLVNLLGVPTCVEEDLIPPTKDNPRGYWESTSLSAFNDRIFAALESGWSCPPALASKWETQPMIQVLRSEAVDLFTRVCPSEQWVWKDPRNCMTFAFWASCLDVEPVILLLHRNPLEIAASLRTRDDLGFVYSLALWERYLRTSLAAISGLPTLVTTYDEILAEPLTWCERVGEFLRDVGMMTTPLREQEAFGFIGTELRHSSYTPEDVAADPAVSTAQHELCSALEELEGAHAALSMPDLPPETRTTEALLAERRRLNSRDREYRELGEYARMLGEQFVELERTYVELERTYIELRREAKTIWAQFGELKEYSDDLGQRYLALEKYSRELQERVSGETTRN